MLANSRVAAPSTRAQTRFRGTNFGGSINLEGDVASYVVAKSAVTNAPSAPTFPAGTSPIADALETYLSPGTTGGPEWLGRSRAFLGMLGGTLTGNTLTNRIAVVATVQVKIEEFASYYLVNRLRQTGTLTSANLRNAAIFLNGASQEVAEIFIDALVDNVANPNQRIRAVTDPAPRGTGPIPPQCQRTIDAIEKMEAFDRLQRELKRRLGF